MALPTPLAYWPFDEGTGTTAADASGNGHTATLSHGAWDTSALKKFGAAALANTDGGPGATFTAITLGTVHTVAFWLNGWGGTNDGLVLGNATSNANAAYISSTIVSYDAGGGANGNRTHGGLSGSHHLCITRSGTTVKFYKDGAQLGATLTLPSNPALSLSTISGYPNNTFAFVATLDDVRLYDAELSAAQVAELYALNPDGPAAGVRVTQAPVEALTTNPVAVRVTHDVVELLGTVTSVAAPQVVSVTQDTVELLLAAPVATQVTQYIVEALGGTVALPPPKDYTWQITDMPDVTRWMTGLLVFPEGDLDPPAGPGGVGAQVFIPMHVTTRVVFPVGMAGWGGVCLCDE